MDDAGELLGWPFEDPAWPRKLLLAGLLWCVLSLTIAGIPLAAVNLTGWMLTAADNLRSGKRSLPPAGFYLGRGVRLFTVQLAYFLALLAVCGLPIVAGVWIGGIGGGLLAVFGQSLLLLASTLLVAITPAIVVLTEAGGVARGLDLRRLGRFLAADPRAASSSGLMSLLCLDIISPFGLLACGLGLVVTTPYAYAVLASTVVAYESRVRR